MEEYFEIRQSKIHGFGMFCIRDVSKNSLFPICVSRARKSFRTHSPNSYALNFFVNKDCLSSECVFNGQIHRFSDFNLDDRVFEEKYVISSDISMYANDMAWPSHSESEYEHSCDQKNNIELMLVLGKGDRKNINGVVCRITNEIYAGEECGNTYGYEFWKDTLTTKF